MSTEHDIDALEYGRRASFSESKMSEAMVAPWMPSRPVRLPT